MQDQTKNIRILAMTGLGIRILYTVLFIGISLFPKPILTLFHYTEVLDSLDAVHHPLRFVMPLLDLGIYVFLYYLLRAQCRARTSFSATLIGLILAAIFVIPLLNLITNYVTMLFVSRLLGAAEVAAVSAVTTAISWVGILNGLSYPLLLLAAGMNHSRPE